MTIGIHFPWPITLIKWMCVFLPCTNINILYKNVTLWMAEVCLSKIHRLRSYPLSYMAIFGERVFKHEIKVKWSHGGRPQSNRTGVFVSRGDEDTDIHRRPHEDTERRPSSTCQGRRPQKKPTLLTSGLQNREKWCFVKLNSLWYLRR